MKELFSFTVKVNKEVEKTETKEENGKTISVTQKVKEDVPVKIIIKSPSRKNIEDADMQLSIEMSNCIKKGILTKGMLLKKYSDSGGFILEEDRKELARLNAFVISKQDEYSKMISRSERDKVAEDEIIETIMSAKRTMLEYESAYANLFENTADSIAVSNVIRWFCLHMAHKQEGDGPIQPLFEGETTEEKQASLHKMDEAEEPIYSKAYRKLATFVSFWYYSKNAKKEDFEKLNSDIENGTFTT